MSDDQDNSTQSESSSSSPSSEISSSSQSSQSSSASKSTEGNPSPQSAESSPPLSQNNDSGCSTSRDTSGAGEESPKTDDATPADSGASNSPEEANPETCDASAETGSTAHDSNANPTDANKGPDGNAVAETCTPTECGTFTMQDKEMRTANEQFVLEVVPTTLSAGDAIAVSPGNAESATSGPAGCPCAAATVCFDGVNTTLYTPSNIDGWTAGDSTVPDSYGLLPSLGNVEPHVKAVHVTCGLDQSSVVSGEVHIYPSDKISISASSEELIDKFPNVKSMLEGLASILSAITGKTITTSSGVNLPVQGIGTVIISAPELALEFEGQWKEYPPDSAEDWQAYYGWKASLSISLAVQFQLDVLAVAADIVTASLGAPLLGPQIIALAQKIKDAIGQETPLIYLGLKAECKGSGSIGYEDRLFGSLSITDTGTISIGGMIHVEDKDSSDVVEASADGFSAISSTISGQGSAKGLKVAYEILKWEGVSGKVHVKIVVGKILAVGFDNSAMLVNGSGPLVKGDDMLYFS